MNHQTTQEGLWDCLHIATSITLVSIGWRHVTPHARVSVAFCDQRPNDASVGSANFMHASYNHVTDVRVP
jgi:hypothetical protein